MKASLRAAGLALATFAGACGVAEAQWALVARKAAGVVRQMTSEASESQAAGYDVATVLLDARADHVYRKALEVLGDSRDLRTTRRDDRALTVEFTDGRLQAGLQVSALDEHVSQLVIASTTTRESRGGASLVLNNVLRVCRQAGVHCEAQRP